MTWFKVDDSLPDHPKVVRLQTMKGWQGALALWTLAGAWASRHLTDGLVPEVIVGRLGGTRRDAEMLVEVGMWSAHPEGYAFHGWAERNPTRRDVEDKRERTRSKVAEWRRNRSGNRVTRESCNPAPVPTRPDPSRPDLDQREGESGAGAPATSPPPVPTSVERSRAKLDTLLDVAVSLEEAREGTWTAQAQREAFQVAYERSQRTTPAMGGRRVGSFHGEVLRTAELQGRDPGELFAEALSAWLARGLSETERRAPYACFQAAWGDLTAKGAKKPPDGSGGPPAAPRTYSPEDLKPKLFPKDRA